MPDSRSSQVITVRLVYLARLRDVFGRAEETVALPTGMSTIAAILKLLRDRGGSYAFELASGRAVRIALNHALVGLDALVHDGDEVALLPPVTGG